MAKSHIFKIFVFLSVFVFAIFFAANELGQAQSQTKGKPDKPPGKPKPEPKSCNNNGVCESDEYDSNFEPGNQPCPDCLPKIYPPLVLDQSAKQIACVGRYNLPYSDGRVYQYKCLGGDFIDDNKIGVYEDTWASHKLDESYFRGTSLGDADNDGEKEIVTVINYHYEGGKGKNKWNYYDSKIVMFKDGSDGNPDYSSEFLGKSSVPRLDAIIADVDNDGLTNELIMGKVYNIIIYEWIDGVGFAEVWTGPSYGNRIEYIEVGDSDNDGENEIILAMFDVGSVFILEYLGEDASGNKTWSDPIYSEPITICEPSQTCKIDMVRVRDVDYDGKNEIIAGGNNNRLMVWEYDSVADEYSLVFVSDNLGGYTQGVDAGDINGDGSVEIVIATFQSQTIYIFRYSYQDRTYYIVNSMMDAGGVYDLSVGDVDGDGIDEIVMYDGYSDTEGIKIFDFIGADLLAGYLQQTYYSPYGARLEID
jgi:hypothetical protein